MIASICTGYFLELITLFGIVFIHELGHVVVAKGFGWRVSEVQLLPFGGVAVVEEAGNLPASQELWVALAGPLQNLWMIGFAFLIKMTGWSDPEWWDYFITANVWIGLFNLLPILPLDGGKVALSLISYRSSYLKALRWCSIVSLLLSAGMVLFALISFRTSGVQLNLFMIGLYLFIVNWFSYRHVPYQFRRFLMSRKNRAKQHMERGALAQPIVVGRNKKVSEIVHLFVREQYHLIFIINDHGVIQKVIPEQKLIHCYFSEQNPGSVISDLMM